MDELTRPAGAPREAAVAEVERLRAEVERLARDNAALRSQVATLESGAVPAAASGAGTASPARRWIGRLLMLFFFVVGVAIGAWSVHLVGSEFMRGYRDGRADGAADRAAPAAPADRPTP